MIEISLESAYLWLSVGALIAWSFVYFFGTSLTRKEQVIRGIISIPCAIAIENLIFFQDYWFPQSVLSVQVGSWHILLEDVIFGFSMGGLIPILSHLIGGRECIFSVDYSQRMCALIRMHFMTYLIAFVLVINTDVNSMILIPVVMIGVSLYYLRTLQFESFTLSLKSGFVATFILAGIYVIGLMVVSNTEEVLQDWWYLHDGPLDVRISGVPLTEIMWVFSYGVYSTIVNQKITQRLTI